MPRRVGSLLLLLGLLLAMAPSFDRGLVCGSMAEVSRGWTPVGAPASGCTTSMPAASCLGTICLALPTPHELAVAGIEHHFTALPPSDLISLSPPPPQPPPPEA